MGDGKADNVLLTKNGHMLFCDIASTFNATLRPCDKGEFMRSVQSGIQDGHVTRLKEQFERYWHGEGEYYFQSSSNGIGMVRGSIININILKFVGNKL
jgi:hypothetical protein